MSEAKVKSEGRLDNQENLYKRNGSTANLSNAESDDIPENMYRPEKEDLEGWIHREKLAKIENEELQAAGINLAKARSRSRDALGNRARTASRDQLRNDLNNTDTIDKDEKRRKVSSPAPVQPDEGEDQNETSNWDLRSPEEIAAEQANAPAYTTPVLRKSGSKIPVLSASPSPPSSDIVVSRKRTISGTLSSEEGLSSTKLRTPSSKRNDDSETPAQSTSSKPGSPNKTRQKSISGISGTPGSSSTTPKPASATRKPSLTSKPTPASPNGRPRTRGNDTERPRTAVNPPEGDPPWLADMYKPDPRLPPDQQLIPTVAKRRQQMQWEENGMIPKTYDRDFSALAVHENGEPRNQNQQPTSDAPVEGTTESESWPLKPLPNPHAPKETSPVKPAISSSQVPTGGYSTMPKVSSPPISISSPKTGSSTNVGAPSPNIGPLRPTGANSQQPQRVQQRPTSDEEDEKAQKKGCACCVVM